MIFRNSILVILSSIILISCNNNSDNGTNPVFNKNYPAEVNLEWEYNTVFNIGYYDSAGHISHSEIMDLENTIVKIFSITDNINGMRNLIKFISYDTKTPGNVSTNWYQNKEDGFYSVAYKFAGSSQQVLPKNRAKNRYLTLSEFDQLSHQLMPNLRFNKASDDSIVIISPPHKVIAYPIIVGNKWTEFETPFKRERTIIETKNISINGKEYQVYVISDKTAEFDLSIIDYIGPSYGLLKREVSSDSLLITTEDYPDGIGYAKVTSNSTLVQKNF